MGCLRRYAAEGLHQKELVGLGDVVLLQLGKSVAMRPWASSTTLAREFGKPVEQGLDKIRAVAGELLQEIFEFCKPAVGR
eukprot:11225390-Lingulodinium_polyedra.AAC.1